MRIRVAYRTGQTHHDTVFDIKRKEVTKSGALVLYGTDGRWMVTFAPNQWDWMEAV